jgi:type II secretion system protein L
MTEWIGLLNELNLQPTVLTTDLLALPALDQCHVFIDGERALIRTGGSQGLCVATDMIATTISLLPEEQRQSVQLTLPQEREAELQLTISQVSAEPDIAVEISYMEYSPFETLARGFNLSAVNFLQGGFKVESHDQTEKSAWRSVAIWAGCALLLHLFVVMGQAVYLDVQARQLDAEARALYASIYPNDRNVRDMRRRWQSHLRSSGGGATGEFMSLFVETTKHIPGANLNLDNLSYNESRGDLVLQLQAGRSEQLIGFAETLNKMGLEAEIGTINQSDDSVRGSVKVKMVGGS